jgi:hypothetical protein
MLGIWKHKLIYYIDTRDLLGPFCSPEQRDILLIGVTIIQIKYLYIFKNYIIYNIKLIAMLLKSAAYQQISGLRFPF